MHPYVFLKKYFNELNTCHQYIYNSRISLFIYYFIVLIFKIYTEKKDVQINLI